MMNYVCQKAIMAQKGRRRSKEEMYPIIDHWQSSGLTKQSFCDQQGIAKSVLCYWHKKYKSDQEVPNGFLPIKIGDDRSMSSGSKIEIEYPNGVVLRLPDHTPSAVIRQYLYL